MALPLLLLMNTPQMSFLQQLAAVEGPIEGAFPNSLQQIKLNGPLGQTFQTTPFGQTFLTKKFLRLMNGSVRNLECGARDGAWLELLWDKLRPGIA